MNTAPINPIGGSETVNARDAVDEMVDAWQLHDAATSVPGAAINAANVIAHSATTFTREQHVTALAYATRTIALLRNAEVDRDAS